MDSKVYFWENVYYDHEDRTIYKDGKKIKELRPKEFELLEFLFANIDTYCTSDVILDHVWSNDSTIAGDKHLIADTVSRLRSVLTNLNIDGLNPKDIFQVKRTIGYRINSENIFSSSKKVREIFKNTYSEWNIVDYNDEVSIEDIFDHSDITCCVCPDIPGVMNYKQIVDGIHIDYDFGTDEKENWPDFISVVYNFYNNVNLLKYYNENNNLKLHLLLNNQTKSFDKLHIELQTESNYVIGNKRSIIDVNKKGSVVEIPLSEYSKYKKHLSQVFNLCFVICKEYFTKAKGSFEIRHICFR